MYWVRALVAVAWLVSLVPASVSASPEYSPVLRHALDLPCDPTCLLCHTRPEGGFATANTKLGITLRKHFDAECCDTAGLEAILVQLAQAQTDSDGDGVSDIAELRVMSDPNVAGSGAGDAGAADASVGEAGDDAGTALAGAAVAGAALACEPAAHDGGCGVARVRGSGFVCWASVCLGGALLALRRRRRSA